MPDIRRPEFLKNSPDQAEERKPDASRLRPVAWAAAPNEPSRVLPTPPPARVGPPPAPRPMPAPVATAGAMHPRRVRRAASAAAAHGADGFGRAGEAEHRRSRRRFRRFAHRASGWPNRPAPTRSKSGCWWRESCRTRADDEPRTVVFAHSQRRATSGDANKTVIKLSPGDVARLHDAPGADLTLGRVEVVADPSLGVGDVVVETEHHTVDGRLATRFDEIRRELLGTLEP